MCMLAWSVALCIYDVRHRRLPNWLTLPGAALILAAAVINGHGASAMWGALGLFAVYAVVHLVSSAAMGAGDVKLAIGIGALTGSFGSDVWLLAALGAPLLTAAWAVVVTVRRSVRTIPHGPSMCLAAATAVALTVM